MSEDYPINNNDPDNDGGVDDFALAGYAKKTSKVSLSQLCNFPLKDYLESSEADPIYFAPTRRKRGKPKHIPATVSKQLTSHNTYDRTQTGQQDGGRGSE